MSFNTPDRAIPTSIYSRKVSFETERTPLVTDPDTGITTGGDPIADQYILMYKAESDSTWISYVLSSDAKYLFIDDLSPQTLYISKWRLNGKIELDGTVTEGQSDSEEFTFKTRQQERFQLRPAIPYPLMGTDFTSALQSELDEHINYINTLDDETSIERLQKEGVGKITNPDSDEAKLTITGGGTDLYITNGYFQSGSGLPSTDSRWYPGAKFWQINDNSGFLSLNTSDTLLATNVLGSFYGYMGAYLDEDGSHKITVIWSKTLLNPRPDGRWLIGKITITDAGLYDSVDTSVADFIPSLQWLSENAGSSGGNTVDTGSAASLRLDYIAPTAISLPYTTGDDWLEVIPNKNFEVINANAIISISVFSDLITEGILRFVVDGEVIEVRRELVFNNNGIIYLNNLPTGIHTLSLEVKSAIDETIEATSLRLQVLELAGAADGGTGAARSARDLIYNPENPENPRETTFEDVEAFKVWIVDYINDKLIALDPGQNLSLDYFFGNIGRALVGQGETNPASLLRVDATVIIPEKFGQEGITLTVDGEEVESPRYEGEGDLLYDPEEDAWVV
jgi:hypothetical protein